LRPLRETTRSVPVILVLVADPVGAGFVDSFEAGLSGKWLAMLKDMAPGLARAALVINPKAAKRTACCIPAVYRYPSRSSLLADRSGR
jgi:putative ABC transport system substrate-binding protein